MNHLLLDLLPAALAFLPLGALVIRGKPAVLEPRWLGALGGLAVVSVAFVPMDALSTAGLWRADLWTSAAVATLLGLPAKGYVLAGRSPKGWVLLGESEETIWAAVERAAAGLRIPLARDGSRARLAGPNGDVTLRRLPFGLLWVDFAGDVRHPKLVLFRKVVRKFLVYGSPAAVA